MIAAPEAYATWRDAIEARPEVMFAPVRDRFRAGAGRAADDYIAAWQALRRVRREWHAAVAGFDAVTLPTTANLPPEVDRLFADPDLFATENLLALRNPNLASLLGLCAITLPGGTPACGLTLMAAPGDEPRLLRLAAAVERALA